MLATIEDFGARGDGTANDTDAFQKACEAVHARGGGRVVVPPGRYNVAAIRLRDGVELHLTGGAELIAIRDKTLYPEASWGRVVWALDAHDVAVTGAGVIDCEAKFDRDTRHDLPVEPYDEGSYTGLAYKGGGGPGPIILHRCTHARVEGIHLRNAGEWSLYLLACDDVLVDRVTIRNSAHSRWTDGVDVESCDRVLIRRCDIATGDDAVSIKSAKRGTRRTCSNVTIEDCLLASETNGLRLGTETAMDITNIRMERCRITALDEQAPGPFAGFELSMSERAELTNVVMRDLTIVDARCPFLVRLQLGPDPEGRGVPGRIANVLMENITAINAVTRRQPDFTAAVIGLPGSPIENVTLRNIDLRPAGGGEEHDGSPVPEPDGQFVSPKLFGRLPSKGLYLRHARGVTLEHVHVRPRQADPRPALVTEYVDALRGEVGAG